MRQSSKPTRPHGDRDQGRKSLAGDGQQIGKSPILHLRVIQALKDKVEKKGAQWARDVLTDAE